MEKTVFTIGNYNDAYIGFTAGRTWNGWACPYFCYDEAIRIMHGFNECAESPMYYDEATDSFCVKDEEGFSEIYKGIDIATPDGIKHLYPIGYCCWVWDREYTNVVAKELADFLWEYDTYEYWNTFDRDTDAAKEIEEQLQDIGIFKEVIIILRNEDLSDDEKFEKLGEVSKL